MTTRREFVVGASMAVAGGLAPIRVRAQDSRSAEAMIAGFERDPAFAEGIRGLNDAQAIDVDLRANRGFDRAFAPRIKPSSRMVSKLAERLIISCEVTSGAVYTQRYRSPAWPGGSSGPTIGVGYDLRFITNPQWLHEDWGAFIDKRRLEVLTLGCRLHDVEANRFCVANRGSLLIAWEEAEAQFRGVLLPRYIAETEIALPNSGKLSDDALGALVSLVYNRGASFRKAGSRYTEMRQIYFAMRNQDFASIPGEILAMRRLWPNVRGLIARREAEAELFRKGLA